jgi:hypothetical protein
MSNAPEITTYGIPGTTGGRRRSFVLDGIKVTLDDHEDDERGRRLAEFLSGAARQVERLAAENRELRASAPPANAVRLLGPGIVRFRGREVWLLNSAERGWASFGIRCDGWDDLFRRYDVRVTGHDQDETGPYWIVENNRETKP